MQKDIFTKEQEEQIRKAFDKMDNELGLHKLDDDRDLDSIFSKVQDANSSKSWLAKHLHEVEEKLTKLTHAIEILLEQNKAEPLLGSNQHLDAIRAMERNGLENYDIPAFFRRQDFEVTKKDSSPSAASYLKSDFKDSIALSSLSDDLRVMRDKLIQLNFELEKKQEESLLITESISRRLSHEFEEKLNRLTLALEKQEELLRVAEAAYRKNSDYKLEDLEKPEIDSSPRQVIQSQKTKRGRSVFSFLGGILVSPSYAFASVVLIVSFGLAIGFQASELSALKQAEDPLRGSKEVFQIVDNPMDAAHSLISALMSEEIPYHVEFESKDKIKIKIPVNEKTIRLMGDKRIELPHERQCVLVFEKAK